MPHIFYDFLHFCKSTPEVSKVAPLTCMLWIPTSLQCFQQSDMEMETGFLPTSKAGGVIC